MIFQTAAEQINLDSYLEDKRKTIDAKLKEWISSCGSPSQTLVEAAMYSLFGGGKRLRPLLTMATADTFGVPEVLALTPACAVEMIHTYSLIHDDLPCMDNDDYRRGKPTLHKAFNEGYAVLAGDFLLTYAFEILAKATDLSERQKIDLIQTIGSAAGAGGMVGGQMLDLESEGAKIDLESLQRLHHHKTGALLKASIVAGGIIANLSKDEMDLLKSYGEAVGLAFQIVDDILDVTESIQKHGKGVPSDVANQKSTYVSCIGLENSQQHAKKLLEIALNKVQQLPMNTSLLQALAQCLILRKI